MTIKNWKICLITLMLLCSACMPEKQASIPTETLSPTIKPTFTYIPATSTIESTGTSTPVVTPTLTPTSTEEALLDNKTPHTVLKFKFPFEPGFPGYSVQIKSAGLTANLMCSLDPGKTGGEILDLDEKTNASETLGSCDSSSMTLNILIPDQITVTVILGGFPVVNNVTQKPDAVSDQQIEYYFEYRLE